MPPCIDEEDEVVTLSMGPLNGLRFRLAKTKPGPCGAIEAVDPNAAVDSVGKPARTSRRLDGKVVDVGVAGSTLMLLWGLLGTRWLLWPETDTVGDAMLTEEVDDALLWLCWW